MSWCETECKKKCAIGETECNETRIFILRRQRIDQKRKKGWGRRERIEKGSRERIEMREKRQKGTELRI